MRIPAVAFFVLLCLSGCAAKPAAEIPEPEPGMQLVECKPSEICETQIKAQIQIPEDWKMQFYDAEELYRDPWTSTYALMLHNEDETAWITGGEVVIYGYSDIMEQTSNDVEGDYLYSTAETKEWIESDSTISINEITEGVENGYTSLYADYIFSDDGTRYCNKYISNDEENSNYFQVELRVLMDVADEETAAKILDSLVIAE